MSQNDTRQSLKHLTEDIAASDVGAQELRRIGWYDFRDYHAPTTSDLVEVIAATISYCCFDADGAWNGQITFLATLLGHLKDMTSTDPGKAEVAVFANLVSGGRVNQEKIDFWLAHHFRVNATDAKP